MIDIIGRFKTLCYLEIKSLRKSILIPVLGLFIFGLLMSFSLSYSVSKRLDTSDFYFFTKHLVFVVVAMLFMLCSCMLSYKSITKISYFAVCGCLIMLVLVFVLGPDVKGAKRWIDLGFISIQPSEILKPFYIILNSVMLIYWESKNDNKYFILVCCLYFVVLLLLALEPDFGMIIVYTMIFAVQLFFSKLKLRYFTFVAIGFAILLIASSLMFEHVRFRVHTFFGGGSGDNYQSNIALNAIRQGGIFGQGIGESGLKYRLPDAHNDFIFAVIGEELGYFAYVVLMFFYFSIFLSGLSFLIEQSLFCTSNTFLKNDAKILDKMLFNRFIIPPIIITFFTSFTINAFVSLGLFPTKGITLPFVSYGGSSMVSYSIMVGILLGATRKIFTVCRILR